MTQTFGNRINCVQKALDLTTPSENSGLLFSFSFEVVIKKFIAYVLSFYPPKSCFRILILFLESKFLFSAHISSFYVMIYNAKWIGILNTDLNSKLKLEF